MRILIAAIGVIMVVFGLFVLFRVFSQNNVNSNLHKTHVVGVAMLPTIKDGDTVTVSTSFDKSSLKRGDIVLVQLVENGQKINSLKRIVGMGGETLKLVDGSVYINGTKLDEPYLYKQADTGSSTFLPVNTDVKIPSDSVFVMGDYREHSYDSRQVGSIKVSNIQGILVNQ